MVPNWRDDLLLLWFGPWSLLWIINVFHLDGWNGDGLIYREASVAWLAGTDPWASSARGLNFAALPPAVVLMSPSALLPEWLFTPLWLILCGVAAAYIVRRLGLAPAWFAFFPLVQGVALGNPAIPALALVLAGWEPIALMIRPHLVFALPGEGRWKALGLSVMVGVGSLVVAPWPQFLSNLPAILSRYEEQAGGPGAAASGTLYAVGIAAALIMVKFDRRAAGWLAVLVIPSPVAYHGAVAVMPLRRRLLGLVLATPTPGLSAIAAVLMVVMYAFSQRRPRRGDKHQRIDGGHESDRRRSAVAPVPRMPVASRVRRWRGRR